MKDKESSTRLKVKGVFQALQKVQYGIAAISYLIVFSLSILCLASYLPHLSEADVLDAGTVRLFNATLIIILVFATAFFGWEMLQWRRSRAKKEQPSIEDIIKNVKEDSSDNPQSRGK